MEEKYLLHEKMRCVRLLKIMSKWFTVLSHVAYLDFWFLSNQEFWKMYLILWWKESSKWEKYTIYLSFSLFHKHGKILPKYYSGHFCQAQILILLGVCSNRQKEKGCGYKCFHKKTTLSMRMSLKNVQLNKLLLQLF